MKERRLNFQMMLLLGLCLLFLCSILSQGTESETQLVSTQEVNKYRLIDFEDLAYEVGGEMKDVGTLQNIVTGETVLAWCTAMDASDPAVGDLYLKSGDAFSPVSDGYQTFQTFEVIQLSPTPIPTETPIATLLPTESISQDEAQLMAEKKPLTILDWIISFVVIIVLLGGMFLYARFLWRNSN